MIPARPIRVRMVEPAQIALNLLRAVVLQDSLVMIVARVPCQVGKKIIV